MKRLFKVRSKLGMIAPMSDTDANNNARKLGVRVGRALTYAVLAPSKTSPADLMVIALTVCAVAAMAYGATYLPAALYWGVGQILALLEGPPPPFVYYFNAVGIYLLPAILAQYRRHHNRAAITALSVFGGWTVVGWIVAIVWVFYKPPSAAPPAS